MFGFIKRCTFTRLAFLLTLTGVNMLGCVSMHNQECRISRRVLILMGMIRYFFHLILNQVNVVVVATISIIQMQNCVFLIL